MVPAHAQPVYQSIAPTLCDSTIADGDCWSVFKVAAVTSASIVYFESVPDSGYSLDNLAPAAPTNLVLVAGNLSWDESLAADFDYFTVYGSATADLSGATVLGYTTGTDRNIIGEGYNYLLVTATDFSGNESMPIVSDAVSGVSDAPRVFRLLGAAPNPFNPRTTIRFESPDARVVDLQIYDASGRLVRDLLRGQHVDVGDYEAEWNGKDEAGRTVAAGVYFYALRAGAESDVGRLVLLK